MSSSSPVLLLAVADKGRQSLHQDLQSIFSKNSTLDYRLSSVTLPQRQAFWAPLLRDLTLPPPPRPHVIVTEEEDLPKAPSPVSVREEEDESKLTVDQLNARVKSEDNILMRLRMFLRGICNRLIKTFKEFAEDFDRSDGK
jgi:hypothetical protein